ncbi:MAG: phosphate ABC transporter permease PstA [Candidatus Pelagadaptatus aseana]|uniref:phosphate ABC transporter permease PstA n=1 Tax=Candidatus Pelagadaptatus aseana TaxID=3120508 RepID=UPI0039B261B6
MSKKTIELVNKNLAKRKRAEKRFRLYGISAIGFGLACLLFLFTDIIGKGHTAFLQTYVKLNVTMDAGVLEISDINNETEVAAANYQGVIKQALRDRFPDVSGRRDKRKLYALVSNGAGFDLRKELEAKPELLGQNFDIWVLADDDIDTYIKSRGDDPAQAFTERMSDKQLLWVETLLAEGAIEKRFNRVFFENGDSREPEIAGIRGALMGSLLTLFVTFILSFPIGVAAAIYLEEYAPKNRFTDFIEVNINNLAAVPSIIFGLLGLAIFINLFEMQRSIPLVGGMVLTLMTLPTIIISSRAAIKSVPPSIKEAAMGLGASKMQVILHHTLPLAMPGMMTGAIIGMAQALGETAPLLMIGMVAFIVDIPGAINDPATALPVQIFLWSDSPERAFVERTSAAIMVLLGFLITMNAVAVWMRRRLERRW